MDIPRNIAFYFTRRSLPASTYPEARDSSSSNRWQTARLMYFATLVRTLGRIISAQSIRNGSSLIFGEISRYNPRRCSLLSGASRIDERIGAIIAQFARLSSSEHDRSCSHTVVVHCRSRVDWLPLLSLPSFAFCRLSLRSSLLSRKDKTDWRQREAKASNDRPWLATKFPS